MGEMNIGDKCHPPTAGCTGCAEEVITIVGQAAVSLNNKLISVPYHVERIHVHGKCHGPVEWNDRPDPKGPIDARLEVSFKIQNGRIILGIMNEIRSNPNDTRPSWAAERIKKMVRAKNGSPVDCPEL
jgi:hypothetical protein